MFAAPFDYHRPKSIDEATRLLREVKGARVLAGGHSLIPAMKLRLAGPAALIDIGSIKELSGIRSTGGGLEIGALTTHVDVAKSDVVRKAFPVLANTAGNIGDLQVRNRGTIGGSAAHADPGADYPTVLLMLGAKFVATDGKVQREIAAADFFVDFFTTSLKPGELLTSVRIPATDAGAKATYLKHRHPASAFAVVGVAALVTAKGGKCADVRIAIGGATANPVRAASAEKALAGQDANDANFERAAAAVAGSLSNPISDSYASGEFRTHLATVMVRRALREITTDR